MPEIPLINGGQTVKTGSIPNMPMDTERRPRADFRGIISGLNQIARGQSDMVAAGAPPLLDPNMFAGLERGQRVLAEGIAAGGEFLQHYALKRQEAINQRDIGRARSAMQEEYAKHQAERDKARPETWNADWTKRAEALRKRFGGDVNLSPFARDAIANDLDAFDVTTNARLLLESSEVIHKENGDMREARALEAREAGRVEDVIRIRTEQAANGDFSPGVGAQLIMRDKEYMRRKEQDAASSQVSRAVLTGDEALLASAMSKGRAAGWTDDDARLIEIRAQKEMQEVREQAFADAERDALGEIAFRMASGETVTPSQIDGLVKSKRISPGRAAQLMEAAKREDRPLPSEWDPFIDEVKTYDPDDDPKKEKIRDLINKMIFLNPDRGQAEQFNGVLQDAVAQNTDRNKLVETQLLVAARNQIRDSFAKGGIRRAWNKHMEGALQDPAKMQAFGLSKEQTDKIMAYMRGGTYDRLNADGKLEKVAVTQDYSAAFREFKQAAVARRDRTAAEAAGLSSFMYDLFERAATSDASGDFNDPQKARDAALDEAVLLDQLNQWFRSETLRNKGVPPDEMAVKKKLGGMINGALQGGAARPGGVISSQATSANNRITSYGYASDEWADSNSAVGIGAWVPDDEAAKIRRGEESPFKLKENDFAVSPDVEAKLRKAGVKPGDTVKMKLADGTFVTGRWMDRTANDQQAQALGLPPLRGRWDLYSPSGKSNKDGVSVIGFETSK